MRTLLVFAMLTSTGCASYIHRSYQEQCGVDGLILTGVNQTNTLDFAIASNGRSAQSNGYGETIACRVPATEIEKCQAEHIQGALQPSIDYNSTVRTKRLLGGLGYLAFIVPGIVVKVWADNEYDAAMKKGREIASTFQGKCDLRPSPVKSEPAPALTPEVAPSPKQPDNVPPSPAG